MKRIRKVSITVLLISFFSSCSSSIDTKDNEYLSKIDETFEGKNLEQAKQEVSELLSTFKPFVSFNKTFDRESEYIAKEDEVYESEFIKDSVFVKKAINQFESQIVFKQSFNEYKNKVKLEFKNDSEKGLVKLPEHIKQKFSPKVVFYKDGTQKNKDFEDYTITGFGMEDGFGKMSFIDSIQLNYKVKYVSAFDEVEILKDTQELDYENGKIIIEDLKDNYIYFKTSDTIKSPVKIQAYNEEGKPLDNVAYSYSGAEKSVSEERIEKLVDFLENLKEKLIDEDFASMDDLKSYFKKNVSAFDYFKDEDGYFHRYLYFKGNVDKVKLYFPTETKLKNISFTAVNDTKFGDKIMMPVNDSVLFFNNKLEKILSAKNTDQDQLSETFFEDEDYYYHYDFIKKKVDTLLVYKLKVFENGLAAIQENTSNDDYELLSADNIKLSNEKFEYLYEKGNVLFGERGDKYYFITSSGEEKLLKDVTSFKEMYDDNFCVIFNKEGEKGIINYLGKIIAPIKYTDVNDFNEGIACLENSRGFYGGIDKNGKVVIPFKYNESFEFKNGLALVELEYVKKVIDKTGKIIIGSSDTEQNPESVEELKEGETMYFMFKEKKYDSKGKLLVE